MTVATISQTNAETQELDLFQQETVLFTFRVDQWSLDWLDQMVPEFCVDCVTQAWNLAWDSEILGPRCPSCQWEHPVSRNHIWQRNWFIFSRDYTPSYPSSSRTLVIDQRSTSNNYVEERTLQASVIISESWSWSWTTWSWWRPDVETKYDETPISCHNCSNTVNLHLSNWIPANADQTWWRSWTDHGHNIIIVELSHLTYKDWNQSISSKLFFFNDFQSILTSLVWTKDWKITELLLYYFNLESSRS